MGLWTDFQTDMSGLHPHLPIANVIYSVHISLQYNYVYVETPKCACSTIKAALQRLEWSNPDHEWKSFEDIHNRDYSPLLNLKQVGSIRSLLDRPGLFKFCFVRHPYTRLLSCYLDKIRHNRPQKAEILRQLGLPEDRLDAPVSFEQFVKAVAEQPVASMNHHWRVQYYQTLQDGVPYDFIGRFEQLEDGLRVLEERLSPEFARCLRPEYRNATSAQKEIETYLTPELKEIIHQTFRLDFEHFRYEPA